ncbi:MAG: hypothetical protein EXS55_03180 [Candidatus Magasanikbacteria bacterium]|nr:hypothetical protein [Candidatus Magasanikbacteria bacterium]
MSLSIIFIIAGLWYILTNIHPTGESIFLHYNSIFGIDLIGEWWKIFVLPTVSFLALFANGVVAWWLYSSERVVARFLMASSTIFELALLLQIILIVSLNT